MCGDRCYAACDDILISPEAAPRCAAWGGTLAVIPSKAEADCVIGLSSISLWMGYFQVTNATATPDGWSWVDSDPSTFINWDTGEPNDGEGVEDNTEQCGELYPDGSWNDENCMLVGEDGFACSR
jgi:pulmonary surfactant-associated protein A